MAKEISAIGKSGELEKMKKGERYPQKESYALCRCGKSGDKPFCDGSHIPHDFNGTETASKREYLQQAEKIVGPELVLTDAQNLCSIARFCHLA